MDEHNSAIDPQQPQPESNDKSSPNWLTGTLSDWLELLSSAKSKAFKEIVKNQDWVRLIKLMLLMLTFSGLIIGVAIISQDLDYKDVLSSVLKSPAVAIILTITAYFSLFYSMVAKIFFVSIEPKKAFFVFLALGLPWLPFFAVQNMLMKSYSEAALTGAFIVITWYLALGKLLYNVYLGVVIFSISSKLSKLKVLLSLLIPIILITAFAIWLDSAF